MTGTSEEKVAKAVKPTSCSRHRCQRRVFLTLLAVTLLLLFWKRKRLLPHHYTHMDDWEVRSIHNAHSNKSDCNLPQLRFRPVIRSGSGTPEPKCQRVKPKRGSCKTAHRLLHSQPPSSCKEQKTIICAIQIIGRDRYTVECKPSVCQRSISVGMINSSTGDLTWKKCYSSEQLQSFISTSIDPKTSRRHFGFCFIKCVLRGKKNSTSEKQATQLLLLPPQISRNPLPFAQSEKSSININILLIDSVSREHFFRSLPKTVNLFESINSREPPSSLVLDFELFQAIKSRTYENFQMLFDGFTHLDGKNHPITSKISPLLQLFKKRNYETLWLDGLCWEYNWGVIRHLGIFKNRGNKRTKWIKFLERTKKVGIDRTDASLLSCAVFKKYGIKQIFGGPAAVCYGGKLQQEYNLEYLESYHREMTSRNRPFFSMFVSSVGHEPSARRVQTLDRPLSRYVEYAATVNNMLTIILADHGNSYGKFVQQHKDSAIETFHPSLFIILPAGVQKLLGPSKIKSLVQNQKRLVTMLDLHIALLHLVTDRDNPYIVPSSFRRLDIAPNGLLSPISRDRQCNTVPRVLPIVCLCDDFYQPVNDTQLSSLLAIFGIGMLNRIIEEQYQKQNNESGRAFGRCERLVPSGFQNVKISLGENKIISYSMLVLVPSTMSTNPEKFLLNVNYSPAKGLKFNNFERITTYGVFKSCADKGVDPRLCVCSKNLTVSRNTSRDNLTDPERGILSTESDLTTVRSQSTNISCLTIVERKNDRGVIFEAVNLGDNLEIQLDFTLSTKGMERFNKDETQQMRLKPFSVQYVNGALFYHNSSIKGGWVFHANCSEA